MPMMNRKKKDEKKRGMSNDDLPQLIQTPGALWRRSTSRKGITLMCPKCAVSPARAGKDFRYGGRSFKIRFGPGVELVNEGGIEFAKNKDVAATEYTAYVKCNNGCMFSLEEFKEWMMHVQPPTEGDIINAKSKEPRGGVEDHGPIPGQSPFDSEPE